MIEFNKLTLEDTDIVKPYLISPVKRSCDATFGCTMMWRNYFQTEYAIINDTIIFKVVFFNYGTAFPPPIGKDIKGALKSIFNYCVSHNIKMVFCAATESDVAAIRSLYKAKVIKEDGWSDYIYKAESLANMAGRKFSGQRNHMNRFKKENPIYELKAIGNTTIPDVRGFFEQYKTENNKDSEMYLEEKNIILEVLDNFKLYSQSGIALFVGGRVVGFSIGEVLGDTLYVHLEKADTSISGSYQMIVKEYVRQHLYSGIKFVNREEDLGDPGLRASKRSYHPCCMVDKYTVIVDTNI